MLPLKIPEVETYNHETAMFETIPAVTLQLEHSLISVSKWEAIYHKSFLSSKQLTADEFRDYVRCMTLNKNVDDRVYKFLTHDHEIKIRDYINNPMTATTINEKGKRHSRSKVVTSEELYGNMVMLGIPFECEKWHLNRLIMLIRVCSIQQNGGGGRKMSANEYAMWTAQQNLARRAKGKR